MKPTTAPRPKWRVVTPRVNSWAHQDTVLTDAKESSRIAPYLAATLMVAGLTLFFWVVGYRFTLVNIALLYLLPVLVSAVRFGLWPSFYAAGIGVIAFDFFFVPPIFTFAVSDVRYLVSFAVYLAVATFTANLASRLRQQAKAASDREAVTSALYVLSTQVAATRDLDAVLKDIVNQAIGTFGMSAAIILPDANGHLRVRAQSGFQTRNEAERLAPKILRWVYQHGKTAGFGTDVHQNSALLYMPIKTESKIHGVMCVSTKDHRNIGSEKNRFRVVQALAGLAAVAIARIHYEEEAKIAQLTAESERLRTSLLDSISHELRTPLATIIGAVTGMIESRNILSETDQQELLFTVREGAMRMNRLVTNLLGMVRLESGMLRLNKKWCDLSDIVGVALRHMQDSWQNHKVDVNMQNNLPAIAVDDVLIEQVLVNLLSNAVKYSPEGSTIDLNVMEYDGIVTIQIRDRGIGILPEETEKIFAKFYRSNAARSIPGTGLGLAICKGIIQAHGGEIYARSAGEVGVTMTIRLPVEKT